MKNRTKLTAKIIKNLQAKRKQYQIIDTEIPGLQLRVLPSGTRIFSVRYWSPIMKTRRRYTIGAYPFISLKYARKVAFSIRSEVYKGRDPAAANSKRDHSKLTVTDLCEIYRERGSLHKAERTVKLDESRIRIHIIPNLGNIFLKDLSRSRVSQFIDGIATGKTLVNGRMGARIIGGEVAARSTAALLSAMLTFAVSEGFVQENIACKVRWPAPPKHRERFLSAAELGRLGAELVKEEYHPHARHIIRLLSLTGCRRNEVASLKWSFIDYDRCCLRLPESKTGPRLVPLGEPALEFLKSLPKLAEDYVFAGERTFYGAVNKQWYRIREAAGLGDCRIHDLRHSFASIAAEIGLNLFDIAALLGHSSGGVTSRYIHFSHSHMGANATKVSEIIELRLNARLPSGTPIISRPILRIPKTDRSKKSQSKNKKNNISKP